MQRLRLIALLASKATSNPFQLSSHFVGGDAQNGSYFGLRDADGLCGTVDLVFVSVLRDKEEVLRGLWQVMAPYLRDDQTVIRFHVKVLLEAHRDVAF